MQRELSDYLHLYKGCEMLCTNKDCNDDLEYYGRKSKLSLILLGKFNNGNWKPILRPLSSITDDEMNICREYTKNVSEDLFTSTSKRTAYLLSLHFDLFDLIESGLAIDKTLTACTN